MATKREGMRRKAPLDTPLGIIEAVQGFNAEARKTSGRRQQCPATHVTTSTGNIVFCTKDKGHVEEGDLEHKGYRKRWTDTNPKNVNVGDANAFIRAIR